MWIRPIALYGAPAYYSAAKTHINKIQVIQNSALRVALRRTRRTHIEDLHQEGSLTLLKAEAVRSSHRFIEKKVDDSLIQRLLIEHRIMHSSEVLEMTIREICRDVCIEGGRPEA